MVISSDGVSTEPIHRDTSVNTQGQQPCCEIREARSHDFCMCLYWLCMHALSEETEALRKDILLSAL